MQVFAFGSLGACCFSEPFAICFCFGALVAPQAAIASCAVPFGEILTQLCPAGFAGRSVCSSLAGSGSVVVIVTVLSFPTLSLVAVSSGGSALKRVSVVTSFVNAVFLGAPLVSNGWFCPVWSYMEASRESFGGLSPVGVSLCSRFVLGLVLSWQWSGPHGSLILWWLPTGTRWGSVDSLLPWHVSVGSPW